MKRVGILQEPDDVLQVRARFLRAADIRKRELTILGDLLEFLAAAHDAGAQARDEHERDADENERDHERNGIFGKTSGAFDLNASAACGPALEVGEPDGAFRHFSRHLCGR